MVGMLVSMKSWETLVNKAILIIDIPDEDRAEDYFIDMIWKRKSNDKNDASLIKIYAEFKSMSEEIIKNLPKAKTKDFWEQNKKDASTPISKKELDSIFIEERR